jgi:hypothetical protein
MNAIRTKLSPTYHWRHSLAHLPYATALSAAWEIADNTEYCTAVIDGLYLYSRSRDSTMSPSVHFRALEASYLVIRAVCEQEPTHLRL